jgi:hypothetical protein
MSPTDNPIEGRAVSRVLAVLDHDDELMVHGLGP